MDTLHDVLKAAKAVSVEELDHSALMRVNKDPLAKFVESLSKVLKNNIELCKAAAGKIDEMKSEQILNQKRFIELQEEKLESVKTTVKTEVKSWSEILKKNCGPTPTLKSVKQAVKSVVDENDRTKNIIVYGTKEGDGLHNNDADIVDDLFCVLNEFPKPAVLGTSRLGFAEPGEENNMRPMKVTLANSDVVKQVLSKAHKLKKGVGSDRIWNNVYIAPDRTREERACRRKLVTELKEVIKKDPEKYHYIRDNKIVSVDKLLSKSGES